MYRLSRRSWFAALGHTRALPRRLEPWAADKLKVVTTFTILGDMVRECRPGAHRAHHAGRSGR